MDAREHGVDPYAAIEAVVPWELFARSVNEADQLAQPASFNPLPLLAEGYSQVRRYTPRFLETFDFRAAPVARDVLDGIDALRHLSRSPGRKLPNTAPTYFIRKRWEPFVFTADGLDRPLYELAALTELKNALRSGDMWIPGSQQFKDFETYLLPPERFAILRDTPALPLAIDAHGESYVSARLALLEQKLREVDRLPGDGELPDAEISGDLLKVTPLRKSVPREAELLEDDAFECLPHVKITDLLLEVDRWTHFTRHFTHQRYGAPAKDRAALLTVVLADAINLGLSKMSEACSGITFYKLDTLRAWHIRDETYSMALAGLVNYQHRLPFAAPLGPRSHLFLRRPAISGRRSRGTYRFCQSARWHGSRNHVLHTHLRPVRAVSHEGHQRDGPRCHVRAGRIALSRKRCVDRGALHGHARLHRPCVLSVPCTGIRFAPRIRDLADRRLCVPSKARDYSQLAMFIGEPIRVQHIHGQWSEVHRLVASIRHGTVRASLILRNLGSYPRQNGLALALRELGRIERTLFMLEWLLDPKLRQRVTAGLNKGELKNTLSRAVCFNRLGELRDRTFDALRYRASGLNLVVAAIILWNTVYLDRAIAALSEAGRPFDAAWLAHLAPVHWDHINLTGDYSWRPNKRLEKGGFRPMRPTRKP